jgi:hypothetical protein
MSRHRFKHTNWKVKKIMALIESEFPWKLRVTLGATNDKKVTKEYVLQATDETEAEAAVTAILAALANVSAGKVVSYGLVHQYEEDNYTRPTSEDAEWGEVAVISGKILDKPLKPWSVQIPFPLIGLFLASAGKNRDVIDITDVAVIAYKNLFGTGNQAFVSDGEYAETLDEGRRL